MTADDDVWEALLKVRLLISTYCTVLTALQKHKGVGKWQTRSFPLYDRIAALIDGKQAKGDRTVRVGEVDTSASTASSASSAGSQEVRIFALARPLGLRYSPVLSDVECCTSGDSTARPPVAPDKRVTHRSSRLSPRSGALVKCIFGSQPRPQPS